MESDLTFNEAVSYLQIGRTTLTSLIRENKLASYKNNRHRYFKVEDLDKFLADMTYQQGTDYIKERFLSNVEKQSNGCWLWNGITFKTTGYGQIRWNGRPQTTHRCSYELFVGPIPEGLFVCHTCDIRKCVNPEHLFLGTNRDNIIDCVKKGRHKTPFGKHGEENPTHTLTNQQVQEIRRLSREGKLTKRQIATAVGASFAQVKSIRANKSWTHTA